ncbi:MAG: patatin-like phospholipase family protein, partial [Alphaproteobacteria bacterium]
CFFHINASGQLDLCENGVVEKNRHRWLLSLDGGAIRCTMYLRTLVALEEATNQPIVNLFDGIAGTSMGGIIACMLTMPHPDNSSRPKYFAKDILDVILANRTQIFDPNRCSLKGILTPRYKYKSVRKILSNEFGKNNYKNRLLPTVIVANDLTTHSGVCFATTDDLDFYTEDLAMATGAALTCYNPQTITSLCASRTYTLSDGGTAMNNPTFAGIKLLQEYYKIPIEKINVFSMGAGILSLNNDSRFTDGLLSWGPQIGEIFMKGQLSTIDYMASIFLKDRYHRFNPYLEKENIVWMDDISDSGMKKLKKISADMLRSKKEELDDIIRLLNLVVEAKNQEPAIVRTVYEPPQHEHLRKENPSYFVSRLQRLIVWVFGWFSK